MPVTSVVRWTELGAEEETPPLLAPPFLELVARPRQGQNDVAVWAPAPMLGSLLDYFRADLRRERLCLLLGQPWSTGGDGHYLAALASFAPVPCETASAVHVVMSRGDWTRILPGLTEGAHLLGWAHSHPGHGAFLSQTDMATQACWFARPWSVALVFDPVREELRCFAGPGGRPAVLLRDRPQEEVTGPGL